MLNISKQSDYGLLFIFYLLDKNGFVPLSELVKKTKLPKRFLARIAAQLVKNKIIESKEGKVGGYKLAPKINEVNLYNYLKIFEGELSLVNCCDSNCNCQWETICQQKSFLKNKLNQILISEFKKWKLIDLLKIKS
jgi:Rrf2 family protein